MYAKPPEYTPEQAEKVHKWLNIAGSPGIGCRIGPKEGEMAMVSSLITQFMNRATNSALEVEHNKASHIPGFDFE